VSYLRVSQVNMPQVALEVTRVVGKMRG